jgi:hypothetical protein
MTPGGNAGSPQSLSISFLHPGRLCNAIIVTMNGAARRAGPRVKFFYRMQVHYFLSSNGSGTFQMSKRWVPCRHNPPDGVVYGENGCHWYFQPHECRDCTMCRDCPCEMIRHDHLGPTRQMPTLPLDTQESFCQKKCPVYPWNRPNLLDFYLHHECPNEVDKSKLGKSVRKIWNRDEVRAKRRRERRKLFLAHQRVFLDDDFGLSDLFK